MAKFGGVMGIVIDWKCNLDKSPTECLPEYTFQRLDDANTVQGKGWNFRFAHYFDNNRRTLFKAYGIRFQIIVNGKGGKFDFITLTIKIGSGLGLLAITGVVCDFVVLYFLDGKQYYKAKKYLYVEDEMEQEQSKTPENSPRKSSPDKTSPANTSTLQRNQNGHEMKDKPDLFSQD
jgi:hypothetical protein